jgi:hypothetical protein
MPPAGVPCADSVVVLEAPREDDDKLLVGQDSYYKLFLSSGNQTTSVQLDFLHSWVHVVSTAHHGTSSAHLSSLEYATSSTTHTRCDKLAKGSLLAKASGTFGQQEDDNTSGNLLEQNYRSFFPKVLVAVSSRIQSAPLGPATSPCHRTLSTERKVRVAHHPHGRNFFQAKSILSGEFFNDDATTIKIGNSASSGEETAATTDDLAKNSSIRTSKKIGCGPIFNTCADAGIAVVRTKKKSLKSRMVSVTTWTSLGTFDFPTSTANKRLVKGKRIAAAVVAPPKKIEQQPSVKHLGIFNIDADSDTISSLACATPPTMSTNNGKQALSHIIKPTRCNVVVKAVRSESGVEIQYRTEAVARTRRTYGKRHSHTRMATIELGTAYLKGGESEKAAQTLRVLLDTLQGDERHSLVAAVILEKLGCALASPTKSARCTPTRASKVMEHLSRALQIRCSLLGPMHVDTVECLNTIAAAYFRWEDFANAQRAYYEVLVLRQAIFGRNISGFEHPCVAVTAQMLGQVHARLSELDKALECYQMAERIYNSWQVPKESRSFVSLQQCLKSLPES